MMKFGLWAAVWCLACSPAMAAPAYLDDRSSPEQLVTSLYNAVNRREYARAWDYFSTPPAADFATFSKGYEQTDEVQLTLGGVSSEGAAGSILHAIPVAIRARNMQGNWNVFAGCYHLRQVSATIQDPPFRGLSIEKASLKAASTDNPDDALPKSCGDLPAVSPADALRARVMAIFQSEQARFCDWADRFENGEVKAQAYDISFRYSYDAADQPDRKVTLFAFPCSSGAYNTSEVYYLAEEYNVITGLSFAAPDHDYVYKDPDESAKLKRMTLRGFSAQSSLVNSSYDAATKSISSFSKWRGIGDASSSGTWRFFEGRFILTDYLVDPTYDGKENAFTVMKNGKLLPVKVP